MKKVLKTILIALAFGGASVTTAAIASGCPTLSPSDSKSFPFFTISDYRDGGSGTQILVKTPEGNFTTIKPYSVKQAHDNKAFVLPATLNMGNIDAKRSSFNLVSSEQNTCVYDGDVFASNELITFETKGTFKYKLELT